MASVASGGSASPLSAYDVLQSDPNGDQDDMWQLVGMGASSNPSSVGFFPSPASGSMASWAIVGNNGANVEPSPPALSPLYLDSDQHSPYPPATTFGPDLPPAFGLTSAPNDNVIGGALPGSTSAQDVSHPFLTAEDFIFGGDMSDLAPFINTFPLADLPTSGITTMAQPALDLNIPSQLQSGPDVSPWNTTNLKMPDGTANMFVMEDFVSPSPPPHLETQLQGQEHVSSPSVSLQSSTSPRSPAIKQEQPSSSSERKATAPIAIHRVRPGARVEKKKAQASLDASSVSSSGSGSGSGSTKFLIVTPESVQSHSDRPNPFECFEAIRPTHRGRRGPLANATKENALQVRRLGACFCCHARKVKCDKERPCKNCKKLATAVPQVVCWQFQDFMTVLFPDFIRGHFRKDEMTRFISDNIAGFTVDGAEKACTVELFSGARFSTILSVRAKFFTAKTPDVLQHWHVNVGSNAMEFQSRGSAPIGLDIDGNSQKEELRKKAREYIQGITQEASYVEQLTDSLRHTDLPRKILNIVKGYAEQCDSPLVKRALSIYALHYVMSRHLCLTRQTIVNLQSTKLVPQNVPWVTPRVLNRQIKAVMDELLMRETQALFEGFSKSLKPKSRKEWGPCMAAFLVLCLFMENLETAADTFVIAQNEIDLRNGCPPQYLRDFALGVNREVENMPFKQFAYQFHQIYQTHSRDASTKAFNPLVDDVLLEQGELDVAALHMVLMLRQLLQGPNWSELDFLTADPMLRNTEAHPYPRDVSLNYTGRLVAKFLLSFTDETYIFGRDS